MAGRWFRRVEEGAVSFLRKWHGAERCKAAERHAKAVAAESTVSISRRPGGGGAGGASCPRDSSPRLAIIVRKLVGFPMTLTSYRNAGQTYSACCVLPSLPLMHLIPFTSPMPYLVSFLGLLVMCFLCSLFPFFLFSYFVLYYFPFSFRFLFSSFLSFFSNCFESAVRMRSDRYHVYFIFSKQMWYCSLFWVASDVVWLYQTGVVRRMYQYYEPGTS